MSKVTLTEILASRDARVQKQKNILHRFGLPIISFTMNIAGPVKTSPLIERAFYEGVRLIKKALQNVNLLHEELSTNATGCEAIFCVDCNAQKLKELCTGIEEASPLGRLFDMDVIDSEGIGYERKNPRGCIVCGAPGKVCAAGRLHSVDMLRDVTNKIMGDYFLECDKEYCATLSVKCLVDEVLTTPKPGLVDRRNNGSHKDMDINTFIASANALEPYFARCFDIGRHTAECTHSEAFDKLRQIGIEAESTMYNVTNGVNTHKGAIYSLGTLCAAIGRLWTPEEPVASIQSVCCESAGLVEESVKCDFKNLKDETAGENMYIKYGLGGIREEAASGFESVLCYSLPCYTKLRDMSLTSNDAGAIALLHLIANVKDTNIYRRGGKEGADFAAESARELLKLSLIPSKKQIEALDDSFIERNLSPGGCADLLAVTYFLYALQNIKSHHPTLCKRECE